MWSVGRSINYILEDSLRRGTILLSFFFFEAFDGKHGVHMNALIPQQCNTKFCAQSVYVTQLQISICTFISYDIQPYHSGVTGTSIVNWVFQKSEQTSNLAFVDLI